MEPALTNHLTEETTMNLNTEQSFAMLRAAVDAEIAALRAENAHLRGHLWDIANEEPTDSTAWRHRRMALHGLKSGVDTGNTV
jgi:uncharacterized membrane protein